MKHLIFIILTGFLLTSNSQADLKTVSIGVPEEWNNELSTVKKLLEESYAEIGYKVEFEVLPLARSLGESKTGLLDGEIARGVVSKENNFIPVKPSFLTLDIYAYYKISKFKKVPDANLVKNSFIAFLNGSPVLEKYFGNTKNILRVRSEKQLVTLLITERVDFVLPLRKINMEKQKIGRLLLFKVNFFHVLSLKNKDLAKKIEPVLQKNILTPKYRMLPLQLQEVIQPHEKKNWVPGY